MGARVSTRVSDASLPGQFATSVRSVAERLNAGTKHAYGDRSAQVLECLVTKTLQVINHRTMMLYLRLPQGARPGSPERRDPCRPELLQAGWAGRTGRFGFGRLQAFEQAFQFGADAFGVFGLGADARRVADVLGAHRPVLCRS